VNQYFLKPHREELSLYLKNNKRDNEE
jgi:hypothetical protein